MSDFEVTNHGSVCTIRAVSESAIMFAEENFAVEGWQGSPENFTTDWRVAMNLVDQLASFGWEIE